jgi:hypothetical protein
MQISFVIPGFVILIFVIQLMLRKIEKNCTFVTAHLMNFMGKTLLYILLIMLPVSVFCQKNPEEKKAKEKPNIYLDASAGVSFPLGNYANDDPESEESGYAKTGFFIQANADWMGKNIVGLAFQLTYQSNSLKETAKNVTLDGSISPIGSGNWSNIYLMAGPVFLKQINKLAIDAKLVGGFLVSASPVFKTTNPETKVDEGKTATGFAMGVNIGVGYAISSRVSLKITLGYNAGFPKRESQTVNVYVDSTGQYIYTIPMDITRKRTVTTFNTGLGIIYKF